MNSSQQQAELVTPAAAATELQHNNKKTNNTQDDGVDSTDSDHSNDADNERESPLTRRRRARRSLLVSYSNTNDFSGRRGYDGEIEREQQHTEETNEDNDDDDGSDRWWVVHSSPSLIMLNNKNDKVEHDGSPSSKKETTKGEKKSFTCPHCNKVFMSKLGLNYHVAKKVCYSTSRNDDDDDGNNDKKKKRKDSFSAASKRRKDAPSKTDEADKDQAGSNNNDEDDMICPHCRKSFASVVRKDRHVNQFICRPELKPSVAATPHQQQPHFPAVPDASGNVNNRNPDQDLSSEDDDKDSDVSEDEQDGGKPKVRKNRDKNNSNLLQTTKSGRAVRFRFAKLSYNSSTSSSSSSSSGNSSDDDEEEHDREMEMEEEDEEEEQEDNKAVASAPSRKRANPRDEDEDDSSLDDSTSDNDDDTSCKDEEDPSVTKPKRRKRIKRDYDSAGVDRTTCPFCRKKFKSRHAVTYHLDKYVCRPDQRPNGPLVKGRRANSTSGRKFQRIRGKLQDRTCPNCNRIFTSVLGMQYHRDKRVCKTDAAKTQARLSPNFRLEPGETFVTPYGVVEVINDDRGLDPAAQLPDDIDKVTRSWKNKKGKRQDQIDAFYVSAAASSLVRRRQFSDLYKKNCVTAATVGKVNRTSPWKSDPTRFLMPSESSSDPTMPEESYPDRIVECRFIADQRVHIAIVTDSAQVDLKTETTCIPGSRLFIRRRELTQAYNMNDCPYACLRCGHLFLSKTGAVYHFRAALCVNKVDGAKTSHSRRLSAIERRADYFERVENPSTSATKKQTTHVFRTSKKKRSKIANMPVYPQVWVSLGFKLLPKLEATTSERRISAFKTAPKEPEVKKTASLDPEEEVKVKAKTAPLAAKSDASATSCSRPITPAKANKAAAFDPDKHPRLVLQELERQLRYEESRAVGPMYPGVFNALGFDVYNPLEKAQALDKELERDHKAKKQKTKMEKKSLIREMMRQAKKKEREKEREKAKKRKWLEKQRETKKNLMSTAAIVDMRVLVNEVDTGRYPSVKRYHGEHEQTCSVCKTDAGSLLRCSYCPRANHFTCVLLKYAVQEPEPCDGFMCRRCMSNVIHRRMRAEKRRIEKYGGVLHRDGSAVASKLNLFKGVVEGREYECLEAQGQRVSDLSVLMKDAQNRLTLGLATSSLNALRLAMVDPTRETGHT